MTDVSDDANAKLNDRAAEVIYGAYDDATGEYVVFFLSASASSLGCIIRGDFKK